MKIVRRAGFLVEGMQFPRLPFIAPTYMQFALFYVVAVVNQNLVVGFAMNLPATSLASYS